LQAWTLPDADASARTLTVVGYLPACGTPGGCCARGRHVRATIEICVTDLRDCLVHRENGPRFQGSVQCRPWLGPHPNPCPFCSVTSKAAQANHRGQQVAAPDRAVRVQAEAQRLGSAAGRPSPYALSVDSLLARKICSGPRRCPWIPGGPRGTAWHATDQNHCGISRHGWAPAIMPRSAASMPHSPPATAGHGPATGLPDPIHSMACLFAPPFCEVLVDCCAFDRTVRRPSTPCRHGGFRVPIAERRCDERRHATGTLAVRDANASGPQRPFWTCVC